LRRIGEVVTVEQWGIVLGFANLAIASGVFTVALKLNNQWNVVRDRMDLLYKQYCDEHHIPFVGLKNDF
jgi:hypothetical protein